MPDRLEPIDWTDGEPIRMPLAAVLPPAGKTVQRLKFERHLPIDRNTLVFLRLDPDEGPLLRVDLFSNYQVVLSGRTEGDWMVFTHAHWYYGRYDDYQEDILIEHVNEVVEELTRRFERKRWAPEPESGLGAIPIAMTTQFTYKGFPFAIEVREERGRGWTAFLAAIPFEGRVSIETYDELVVLIDQRIGYYPSLFRAKLAVEVQLENIAKHRKRWGLLVWDGRWQERERAEVEAGGGEP